VNNTVIKAKTGELISSKESDIIQLVLKDGHYYEDVQKKSSKDKRKYPFAKSNFEIYTMNIDISGLNNVDMDEERDISTDKMKNISRLSKDMDSLKKDNVKIVKAFSKNIYTRMGAFLPVSSEDSTKGRRLRPIKNDTAPKVEEHLTVLREPDSTLSVQQIVGLYKDWQKAQVMNLAKNSTTNILTSVQGKKEELQKRYEIHRRHILSLHKKFALAFSCVILFFVGAPLGAIIRKGGLGLPMVIAIILFLTYYFIGVFAENYAKKGNIHPALGAWLSTLIMLPLGIFLTKRATADRGLTNIGAIITDFFKKIFKKKNKVVTT
ncbi:MAG: LptF/LptG family permease, partial [Bacteroidota bacterium]